MHRAVLLEAFAALALLACRGAAAGSACTPGETRCRDEWSALYCTPSGVFVETRCGGPRGCEGAAPRAVCDDSIAAAGDGCGPVAHAACTADHHQALVCGEDHTFRVLQECGGPKGCSTDGWVRCDDSYARAGEACARLGEVSCSDDGQDVLECTGGHFVLAAPCHGPEGCQILGGGVDCDDRISPAGDPCATDGSFACSSDRSMLLRCSGGRFLPLHACRGPAGCSVRASGAIGPAARLGFVCDDPVAVAAAP